MQQIKIGSIVWSIQEIEGMYTKNFWYGETSYFHSTILIDSSLSPQLKRLTLFHEYVHAVLETIGRRDLSEDEVLVDNIANCISENLDFKEQNKDSD